MTTTSAPIYSEIAKQIIKSSIRSAICIDDVFIEPYMNEEKIQEISISKKLNREIPSSLYKSFRQDGECDLDIYHFSSLEESWKPKHMLNNKDLVVIDWELDGPGYYQSTLHILKEIVSNNSYPNTPFIIIYTSKEESDYKEIVRALVEQFHPIGDQDILSKISSVFLDKFRDFFEDEVEQDDVIKWIEAQEAILFDFWKTIKVDARNIILSEISTSIENSFKVKEEKKTKILKKFYSVLDEIFSLSNEGNIEYLFYCLHEIKDVQHFGFTRVESDRISFKINDSLISIFSKDEGKGQGVKPQEVFETFSELICKNPHNFMTLLSLEMKEKLRDDAYLIGNEIASLDERAFFYHMNYYQTRSENYKNEFFDFLLDCWVNEIENYNYNSPPRIFQMAEFYKQEKKYDKIDRESIRNELGRLNLKLSTINDKDRLIKNPSIIFGDIFNIRRCSGVTNDYLICITPMCVCVDPTKVNNNYYFIKSKNFKPYLGSPAEDKIESGYYSLVERNEQVYAIEWDTKPFTMFIAENNINKLESMYCSELVFLDYITTSKENFTQRISNQSFSYGTSVGIDLPHLFKEK